MTEKIINADGSRNWEANILLDNIKRLEFELKVTKADYEASEQENKELREVKEQLKKWNDENLKRQDNMQLWIDLAEEQRKKYRSALEEIRAIAKDIIENDAYENSDIKAGNILTKINEVLNDI